MALSTYASLKERFENTDFSISTASGGGVITATNFYYFAYGVVRGGINLATSLGQVAVNSGEKLQFTINATVRTSGLDPFGFALGAASTNDPTQSKLLAVAWVINSDQETQRTLPLVLELTNDDDFRLDGSVSTFGNLPTPVNGSIRLVADESQYYQYDSEGWYAGDLSPVWRRVYGNQLYLSSTTSLRSGNKWKGGCDVPIQNIPSDPQPEFYGVIPLRWTGQGEESPPLKLWLLKGLSEGSGEIIPQRSQIALIVKVNNSTSLGSSKFDEKIRIDDFKRVRRLDGSSTSLDSSLTWKPDGPFYTLESDLLSGYAIEFSCTLFAVLGDGDFVSLYLKDDGVFSNPVTSVFLGSLVAADLNKLLIVPDAIGGKRLSGKGLIELGNQVIAYPINAPGETRFSLGIQPDTDGQQIGLSGILNGEIEVFQDGELLPDTSGLRAIISTEAGTASASSWAGPVTIPANGRIEATIVLPSAIRDDYPDLLIAGNTEAVRAIPEMRVFVRLGGGASSNPSSVA